MVCDHSVPLRPEATPQSLCGTMTNKKMSSTDSKDNLHTKRRTSSNEEKGDDDHSASSISNDTLASRSYLRNSLASDPWNSHYHTHPQNECESPHDSTTPLPPSPPHRNPHRSCSKNTTRKSRPNWHASYLDLPQVRESMIASISKDVLGVLESEEESKGCRRPMQNDGLCKKPTQQRGKNGDTNVRNHTISNAKSNHILPSTQLLSSLGLDSSSREQDERHDTRPSSLLGALWDPSSPATNPVMNHYDDENICESGAMALVRCMNGDVRFHQGGLMGDRRPCYCIFKTMNARLFSVCILLLFMVLSLVVAVPVLLWRSEAPRVDDDSSATANISNGDMPMSTSYIDANDNMSESEKMSMAEEIIRVCKPKGYDEDTESCRRHCNSKQCCFADLDDERGKVVEASGVTLIPLSEHEGGIVQYCGDDPWEECLIFAGCKPYFSFR